MRIFAILLSLFFLINSAHAEGAEVIVVEVKGIIDPVVKDYVARGIEQAEGQGAEALILEIDTPGGLDASMRSIIQDILDSRVPVVVYVYPRGARAASAGSFILVASHAAAMAPGTNVGAAHPVAIGGEGAVSEKVINDARAYMRSLAELRGRNISMAESFVVESVSISASEAQEQGIIDLVAANYGELLFRLDGMEVELRGEKKVLRTRDAEVVRLPMSTRESLLHKISDPNIAYLLFLIGMYGIILELSNPGSILPGVVGGISLIMALWSFQALSVSATGVVLILFAIILFIAELKVPSHGILTAGGIASLLLGSLMLIDAEKEPFVTISIKLILSATAFTALFFIFAMGLVIKAMRREPKTGKGAMLGLVGVAKTNLSPEGYVLVRGELWRATAKQGSIPKDKKIKVVDVDNLTLVVEEVS
ncbi:NfeD family protein [Candidatus Pyrohabitans sp.]